MSQLTHLNLYPIKSMRGTGVTSAIVTEMGIQHDRCFMITETNGTPVTARTLHKIILFQVTFTEQGIIIKAPNHSDTCPVYYTSFTHDAQITSVWDDQFTAFIAPAAVNLWLSQHLEHPVQLRWIGSITSRYFNHNEEKTKIPLSFVDAFPYLLINQSSFDALQLYCSAPLLIEQFRANLIIAQQPAFDEDNWASIKIGTIYFDIIQPCSRCSLTTINPNTAEPNSHKEPLTTLKKFRVSLLNDDIDFGMYLVAKNAGSIKVGDPVTILKRKKKTYYPFPASFKDTSTTGNNNAEMRSILIHYKGKVITGNTKLTLLEQLEANNINIPFSCRAGICGKCQITLESGEVNTLCQGAKKENGKILSCSCIPKTDLFLS